MHTRTSSLETRLHTQRHRCIQNSFTSDAVQHSFVINSIHTSALMRGHTYKRTDAWAYIHTQPFDCFLSGGAPHRRSHECRRLSSGLVALAGAASCVCVCVWARYSHLSTKLFHKHACACSHICMPAPPCTSKTHIAAWFILSCKQERQNR
jgi:hypothetical protein